MSKGAHWNEGEIAKLAKLARHHTIAELTVQLNRSDASVRRRLQVLGLTPKAAVRTDLAAKGRDLKTQVEALCDEGLGPSEIARRLNASIDYVSFCARLYRGTGSGPGAVTRDHGRERKHILAIAKASKGKGFPYCVAAPASISAPLISQKLWRNRGFPQRSDVSAARMGGS